MPKLSWMTKIVAAAVILFTVTGVFASDQSRLEADFRQQESHMRVLVGQTDEPSCGGTCLKVWLSGKEMRKMDWAIETSQRFIEREFYFVRGKPHLVIETGHRKYDNKGNKLKKPSLEYKKRYWLHDKSAGPTGARIRNELQEHADNLIREFKTHRGRWHN